MQCKKTQPLNYSHIQLALTRVRVDMELDPDHVAEQHPGCCRPRGRRPGGDGDSSPRSQHLNLYN